MPDELKNRTEIPTEAKWNVEAVYASDTDWEKDFGETTTFMDSMKKWIGIPAGIKGRRFS